METLGIWKKGKSNISCTYIDPIYATNMQRVHCPVVLLSLFSYHLWVPKSGHVTHGPNMSRDLHSLSALVKDP